MYNVNLIYEYQRLLLGRATSIPPEFFNGEPEWREKTALDILKYAIECLLRWTPEEAASKLNEEVLKKMKLNKIVAYISFPPGATKNRDYFVYVHKLYPDKIPFNLKTLTLLTYHNVHESRMLKFPKGFFDDNLGRTRALLCMNYALYTDGKYKNAEEIYKTFSSTEGTKFINQHRLGLARRVSWNTDLEYAHDALADNDKDEVLFQYYKWKMSVDAYKKAKRKKNEKKNAKNEG